VSFVIPVFNGSATLDACLSSILQQKTTLNFEVIVVDNNSSDGSEQIASRYPVRVLRESAQGRSPARNRGVREAQGEWIGFIDCDVVLDPKWLEEMHRTVVMNHHSGGQGKIYPAAKKNSLFAAYRAHLINNQTQGRFCHLDAEHFFYPMINTAACLYRKEELVAVGGFDEALESHEDIDLTWRLWMKGATFVVANSAEAQVYWPHGGYRRYLVRAWNMGHSLAVLYRLWDITILQNVQIPPDNGRTVFQLMAAFQDFVFATAFRRGSLLINKTRRRPPRVLCRLPEVRFGIGHGEFIVVNASVRTTWTSESLILKDCAKQVKINLPRENLGTNFDDFRYLLQVHREALVQSGFIRIFKEISAD
jgi:glycosyltransferase involved in cell wall biosynthesis